MDFHKTVSKADARGAIDDVPPSAIRQTAQIACQSADIRQMLLTLLPVVEGIADDDVKQTLLNALAQACADHPSSMATFWDIASQSFAATPPLQHLTAIAIAKVSPEHALGCWRSLAASEPGYGEATTEFAKALLQRAYQAIDENNVAEAVVALHELRSFGSSGNHQWLLEGLPLLAQLNFALGNQALGLEQYKNFRRTSSDASGNERVFSAPISALTGGPNTETRLESAPGFAMPKFMSRIDFDRIGSKSTFEPTIEVLTEATVVPSSVGGSHIQVVLTRERELLIDQFNLHPRYYVAKEGSFLRAVSPDDRALVDLAHHPRSRFLPGDHVLLGGAPNYYHWLFEYLPRMEAVLSTRTPFDTILVNSGFQSFQDESLQLLFGEDQALTFMNTDTTYVCERLHLPTLRPIAEAVAFLRSAFLTRQCATAPRRKLFLSRSDAHPGRIRMANEDVVFSALQQYGFENIILSTLDFREQVDLFSKAEVIVAAHGAALTNIVFAPADCAVFEINNLTNRHYTFFEEIATNVGQPFHRLVFDGRPHPGFLEEDAACEVDVGVLLERISG